MRFYSLLPLAVALTACTDLETVGRLPEFTPVTESSERAAMLTAPLPDTVEKKHLRDQASLWNSSRDSLLGDRRAVEKGDILTVVIEIDEKAEISNQTSRGRSGSDSMSLTNFFGLPQRINTELFDGATLGDAVDTSSTSASSGNGSVSRNEKLELMIAATIVGVLPNGVLHIQGSQEVRVNYEIRELLVEGYVRPEDISRQNEITYEKIASARISYGGRGQITQMQQPRYGQQITEALLPF